MEVDTIVSCLFTVLTAYWICRENVLFIMNVQRERAKEVREPLMSAEFIKRLI